MRSILNSQQMLLAKNTPSIDLSNWDDEVIQKVRETGGCSGGQGCQPWFPRCSRLDLLSDARRRLCKPIQHSHAPAPCLRERTPAWGC